MANNVHLTPELERFAKECVESGRFNSVSEVVRAGLRLLQEAEERRKRFNRMLDDVRAEAEREGDHAVDEVLAEIDAIIAEHDDPRR
jgi:antitoxin ParD1/3/4